MNGTEHITRLTATPRIDELQWIDSYFDTAGLLDYDHLKPILCFSLIWNLFETHACERSATATRIRRSVDRADELGGLSLQRYEGFVHYFRSRYLVNGQTFETFFDRLLLTDPESQTVVQRALSGEAHDINNIVFALLLIAHRIRNNLFHGNKDVQSLPQQTELFTVVNSILTTYLDDIRNLPNRSRA